MRISARVSSLVIASIAFGLASCSNKVGSASAPDKSPIRGLPSDATNILYFIPAAFVANTMYEFDTTEASFRTWVTTQKKPVMGPIQRKSTLILRYNPASKCSEPSSIQDGWVSEWTGEQADEGQCMVYDIGRNRAYFWYHSR